MQIRRVLWEAYQDLLAADTNTLASTDALHVHLVVSSFTPSLDGPDVGDVTLASFTGGALKAVTVGDQQTYYDMSTGTRLLQLLEPAGGWTWICTADPASPQTVYGYIVTDMANAVVYGSGLLPNPVTISEAGQGISIPRIIASFMPISPTDA